jgi:hypothetical protein
MKLLILLSLFSLVGAYTETYAVETYAGETYAVETVSTICFFVSSGCNNSHGEDVKNAINKRPGQYISHSTTSTKCGMNSIIVYKIKI